MNLDHIQHVDAKAGGSNCKTSNKRIIAARRRIEAMQLRQEGLTYRQIGERMGCSTQRAQAIVSEEFARLRAQQNDLAENLMRLAKDRLERLIQVHWQKALEGDKFANQMLLQLHDRLERLLGLAAPKRTEQTLTVNEKDPDALKAQARMMGLDITDLEKPNVKPVQTAGESKAPALAGKSNPAESESD